jgi:hypothetical protein
VQPVASHAGLLDARQLIERGQPFHQLGRSNIPRFAAQA